jgi:hypothetical protein
LVLIAQLFVIDTISCVVLSVIPVEVGWTCREMATWKVSPAILLLCYLASGVVISLCMVVSISPAPGIVAMSVVPLFLVFVVVVVVIVLVVIVVGIAEWAVVR